VREEVRHVIEHVAPGGGFIMGSSHSILVGSKPENFLAMVDETVKTGWY
jgi:uroporphyrinogen-III decarboxylase